MARSSSIRAANPWTATDWTGGADYTPLMPHPFQTRLKGAPRDAKELRRPRDVPRRALKSIPNMTICRLFQSGEVIGIVHRLGALVPLSRSKSP